MSQLPQQPAPNIDPATGLPAAPFLDVPALLDSSHPLPQIPWTRYGTGLLLLVIIGSTILGFHGVDNSIEMLASLIIVGLVTAMAVITRSAIRGQRTELAQLESVEEMIQLRRWPQAAFTLQVMLSGPMRTPYGRIQALIYLSGVLSRYHRFDDAVAVQNYLLDNVQMDGGTLHALRLGRAMAMLREDHLFDADQAINELRRQAFRAAERREDHAESNAGNNDELTARPGETFVPPVDASVQHPILMGSSRPPREHDSAGLALVEIYRDVKTGHPAEAEATFRSKLPILRQQLGHRLADAFILVARAYDLMGQTDSALAMYQKATLLAPLSELQRRYPETIPLSGRYAATIAPIP